MMTLIKDPNDFEEIVNAFNVLGGRFILSPEKLKAKCASIKAFIFDWDGVFNDGYKTEGVPSAFSEIDAAGLNLLRYGYYRTNKSIPLCSIITGENNPGARYLCGRENFNTLYMKVLNKAIAFKHLCTTNNIAPEQVAFIFDDMNDISLARLCGLRFMINKSANPMFQSVVVKNGWCDYITGNEQEKFPIREICELILAFNGTYEQCIHSRADFDNNYQEYLKVKKSAPLYLAKANGDGFDMEKI
jgi:3-deoxy-D-manno-octulosonate 8-phosphate phosphatase (KDO 8-P phosphatase)